MNEDLDNWNKMAASWSKSLSDPKSFRAHLITPTLKNLLGDVKEKKVLDAGCGDGYYANLMTEWGAFVTGIDGSDEMIKIAKSKFPKLDFRTANLMKKWPFDAKEFDIVVNNMVLMHLSGIETFLSEANRVLNDSGRLIISVFHPAFNFPTLKLYKTLTDKTLGRKPKGLSFDYFQNQVFKRFDTYFGRFHTHYHRTLEEYSQEFSKNGFVIRQIIEPNNLPADFLKKYPKLEYVTRLPRFLFFELVKS